MKGRATHARRVHGHTHGRTHERSRRAGGAGGRTGGRTGGWTYELAGGKRAGERSNCCPARSWWNECLHLPASSHSSLRMLLPDRWTLAHVQHLPQHVSRQEQLALWSAVGASSVDAFQVGLTWAWASPLLKLLCLMMMLLAVKMLTLRVWLSGPHCDHASVHAFSDYYRSGLQEVEAALVGFVSAVCSSWLLHKVDYSISSFKQVQTCAYVRVVF